MLKPVFPLNILAFIRVQKCRQIYAAAAVQPNHNALYKLRPL